MTTDFSALCRALAGTDYLLIGGLVAVHGAARAANDVDVLYPRTTRGRLVAAQAPLRPHLRGAPPGLPFTWDAATIAHGLNFTLTTTPATSISLVKSPMAVSRLPRRDTAQVAG
ncbi:MAG: hypothetical protein K2Y23_02825 [Cyanobacteria bacterium]|nr:hypothetical protein [Cyanobacteriota bacterium]